MPTCAPPTMPALHASGVGTPPLPDWLREQYQDSWRGLYASLEKYHQEQERLLQLAWANADAASALNTRPELGEEQKACSPPSPQSPPTAVATPAAPRSSPASDVCEVLEIEKEMTRQQTGDVSVDEMAKDEAVLQRPSLSGGTWLSQQKVIEVSERINEIGMQALEQSNGITWSQQLELFVMRRVQWWLQIQEPVREGRLARLIDGTYWQTLVAVVIAANAAFMVGMADARFEVAGSGDKLPVTMRIVEGSFIAFFAAEVAIRLAVHGKFFFCNDDCRWNWFDMILVLQSVVDVVTDNIVAGNGPNLSVLRTLRALRFVRTLRALRVLEFAADLKSIMVAVINSFASLFWSFAMLGFLFYMFGLIVVQFMTNAFDASDIDAATRQDAIAYFGTVGRAMFSFFLATTNGDSWYIYYKTLSSVSWEAAVLWAFAIAYMQIAMLNILTGMFVEAALKAALPERDALAFEQRREEFKQAHELNELLQDLDKDLSGTISRDEFSKISRDKRMQAALSVFGLDIRDADLFFEMICQSCHVREVDKNFLVKACMKMKGTASNIELQMLQYRLHIIGEKLDKIDSVMCFSSPAAGTTCI